MLRQTVKLLQKNIRDNLLDIGLGNNFLALTSKTQETKGKNIQVDYIKLKSFYTEKETINRMERQHTE